MSQQKQIVSTPHAPPALGPYSQGVVGGGFVFTAMQLPLRPANGKVVRGGIEPATRQLLNNLLAIVEAAGSSPENFIVQIARHSPEVVILVDAMDLGAEPGTVVLNDADRIAGQGPSTHGPAPVAFVEALQMMHPCRCMVLGIQPEQTELDAGLSEPVTAAVKNAAEGFRIVADHFRTT